MKMILSLLLLLPSLTLAKDIPASPSSYVYNDGVLSAGGEAAVSQALTAFEKRTGHQMVVAAFSSLDGANLEDYSNKLFKTWKIGDKKRNDGLLFAMFLKDRKWRVEVGYGFEGTLTDIQASNIATSAAVPYFKQANYDAGVEAVISTLQYDLTKDEKVGLETSSSTVTSSVPPAKAPGTNYKKLALFLLIAFVVIVIVLVIVSISDDFTGAGGDSYGGSSGGSSGGFSGGGGSSGGGGASGGW